MKKNNNRIPSKYGAHAYDLLNIIGKVVEENKSKSSTEIKKAIADALTSKSYTNGASGTLTFDKEGNTINHEFELRIAQNGQFVKMQQ